MTQNNHMTGAGLRISSDGNFKLEFQKKEADSFPFLTGVQIWKTLSRCVDGWMLKYCYSDQLFWRWLKGEVRQQPLSTVAS
uniref:Macaca fascicularis brain cDNA clone: QflA-20638, similar to human potassium voltage-gated channel, shaker-relatedsubfamily, member 2 (KCNA2), mRNA, RefSeq: NM_004974.2 n=1 Tax=Macaca fascicularis TaxID=9541 RepID=I7GIK6_MACFA|nr:unnamed protein product [Macaca fascicularis]